MNDRAANGVQAPVVQLQALTKVYRKGAQEVRALDGIDLRIESPGMVAVVGPSGSGKSSLLHMIGAMDRPTSGEVVVAGRYLAALGDAELTGFRRKTVGFVFQSFNLIPNLTALENVMLPMEFNGVDKSERGRRALGLLDRMDLAARATHRPGELSGGEQQRVAIARALANDPPLVLADEPTGNLDSKTGQVIYELLEEIARERTVVVVTHAEPLAQRAKHVIHIQDGHLAP
ncbi:MAG: macrolide ABC transporter ATP-binding protein [Betaproteobacteria bacterium RIFCSPLOWO2_12_FULL_62_58]|nr:MAG: macrolide ABC transporter ATP-binding protein [Betaproteobacteria bacterium RIFCSPLOWO2_12_FULL_62_58]